MRKFIVLFLAALLLLVPSSIAFANDYGDSEYGEGYVTTYKRSEITDREQLFERAVRGVDDTNESVIKRLTGKSISFDATAIYADQTGQDKDYSEYVLKTTQLLERIESNSEIIETYATTAIINADNPNSTSGSGYRDGLYVYTTVHYTIRTNAANVATHARLDVSSGSFSGSTSGFPIYNLTMLNCVSVDPLELPDYYSTNSVSSPQANFMYTCTSAYYNFFVPLFVFGPPIYAQNTLYYGAGSGSLTVTVHANMVM